MSKIEELRKLIKYNHEQDFHFVHPDDLGGFSLGLFQIIIDQQEEIEKLKKDYPPKQKQKYTGMGQNYYKCNDCGVFVHSSSRLSHNCEEIK